MREQLDCNGQILPSVDRTAFLEAVLARSIQDYERAQSLQGPVFFDRAIPEWVRYLGTSARPNTLAATRLRYASTVFVAEPWPEIYVSDHYREHSFERAARSYETTMSAYMEAGYEICLLPKASIQERVKFILAIVETGELSSSSNTGNRPKGENHD